MNTEILLTLNDIKAINLKQDQMNVPKHGRKILISKNQLRPLASELKIKYHVLVFVAMANNGVAFRYLNSRIIVKEYVKPKPKL